MNKNLGALILMMAVGALLWAFTRPEVPPEEPPPGEGTLDDWAITIQGKD